MHFDHDLVDQQPVLCGDPAQNAHLALFRVDLEQVNPGQAIFADDIGNRGQRAFDALRLQAMGRQVFDVLLLYSAVGEFVLQDIPDHRLDRGPVFLLVGMKAREDRGMLVKSESFPPLGLRDAAVDRVDASRIAVGGAIGLKQFEHAR